MSRLGRAKELIKGAFGKTRAYLDKAADDYAEAAIKSKKSKVSRRIRGTGEKEKFIKTKGKAAGTEGERVKKGSGEFEEKLASPKATKKAKQAFLAKKRKQVGLAVAGGAAATYAYQKHGKKAIRKYKKKKKEAKE